ncbi:MAG: hypothetical protein WB383_08315 [Acidimicrobiales bacterium]
MTTGWVYSPFVIQFTNVYQINDWPGVLYLWSGPGWDGEAPSVMGHPPNLTVPSGSSLIFVVLTSGINMGGTFQGTLTQGATSITGCSEFINIAVGQYLNSLGLFGSDEPDCVDPSPPGTMITSIAGSTVTLGNNGYNEDSHSWPNTVGYQNFSFTGGWATLEIGPLGSITATVTPSTGITTSVSELDILGLRANAEITVTFNSRGTFSVVANYVAASGSQFAPGFPGAPVNPSSMPVTVTVT